MKCTSGCIFVVESFASFTVHKVFQNKLSIEHSNKCILATTSTTTTTTTTTNTTTTITTTSIQSSCSTTSGWLTVLRVRLSYDRWWVRVPVGSYQRPS